MVADGEQDDEFSATGSNCDLALAESRDNIAWRVEIDVFTRNLDG
ncbi:hypothetical protein IWQ51_006820 [Labrenzia sp. EL_142]|nr:hypothetical protein [Labrenzia sp. EL_142]